MSDDETARDSLCILVVEDDPTVAEVVGRYLQRDGYRVEVVADGQHALARAAVRMPDLVVLDLMLPGVDGLEVCRRLRASSPDTGDGMPVPIVMLTAKGDESDRIAGLELGADDYLTKPFSPRELVARVRSVLRRVHAPPSRGPQSPLVAGDLELDPRARVVRVTGHVVTLTAREFDLLEFLVRHPGEVFRREVLLERVWRYRFGDTSTVTVHVRRLREKIEADPSHPAHIQTVWGVGYRFGPAAALAAPWVS